MIDKKTKLHRLEVARQVLLGELFIEEAMERCQIKDKKTMVRWLKCALLVTNSENLAIPKEENSELKVDKIFEVVESKEHDIDQLQLLIKKNKDLIRFQNILSNRINELEALIAHAEKKFKINIKRLK